jgi:hypothetical protein
LKTPVAVMKSKVQGSAVPALINRKAAQVLDTEFKRIRKEKGLLTPELVYSESNNPASPFYKFFLHDTVRIRRVYGIARAHELIQQVRIVLISENTVSQPVRGWVHKTGTREYVPTPEALSDEKMRADLLDRALNELEAFQSRYQVLSELAAVFTAISSVVSITKGAKKPATKQAAVKVMPKIAAKQI